MSQALTTVEHEINALGPQIAALLPPDVSADKFREVALAAIRQKPDLLNCNRQSLFNACLNAAQDGLMPDGREGAIVPRKGQAVWQPMIQGIYKRVKTSGSVASLSANVVYEGETFDVLLGDDDRIVHRRDMSKVVPGNETAVYAIATLKDGTKEREVMTWEQVLVVRQASATPNAGPWVQWPDEMARKTVVRRLAKRLPVLDQADEALHRTIGRVDSLYNFGTPAQEAPSPPLKAAAADMPRAARIAEKAPAYEAPPKSTTPTPKKMSAEMAALLDERDVTKWLLNLERLLVSASMQTEVVEIGNDISVRNALTSAPQHIKDAVNELLATAYGKFAEPDLSDEALGEVEIEGAEKVMAGD